MADVQLLWRDPLQRVAFDEIHNYLTFVFFKSFPKELKLFTFVRNDIYKFLITLNRCLKIINLFSSRLKQQSYLFTDKMSREKKSN